MVFNALAFIFTTRELGRSLISGLTRLGHGALHHRSHPVCFAFRLASVSERRPRSDQPLSAGASEQCGGRGARDRSPGGNLQHAIVATFQMFIQFERADLARVGAADC